MRLRAAGSFAPGRRHQRKILRRLRHRRPAQARCAPGRCSPRPRSGQGGAALAGVAGDDRQGTSPITQPQVGSPPSARTRAISNATPMTRLVSAFTTCQPLAGSVRCTASPKASWAAHVTTTAGASTVSTPTSYAAAPTSYPAAPTSSAATTARQGVVRDGRAS
jgi:hypothetical protein